jgi:hypothetical protein
LGKRQKLDLFLIVDILLHGIMGVFLALIKLNKQSYEAPDNSLFYPPVIAKAYAPLKQLSLLQLV